MEKKEKTPKAPKAPKTPKAKKSKMPEGYIGRPKPMKTKKIQFHKPTVGNWIEIGVLLAVVIFVTVIVFKLINVSKIVYPEFDFYEMDEKSLTKEYVLENNDLKFELDPATTQFTLLNKKSGKVWYSNPQNSDADSRALPKEKYNLKSTFLVKYSTINGTDDTYDTYSKSIMRNFYSIEKKGNEIQVHYTIGDIEREYLMPLAIYADELEELEEGLTKSQKNTIARAYHKYTYDGFKTDDERDAMVEKYPRLEEVDVYIIFENLQTFLKEQVEKMFNQIGYTMEDYLRHKELYKESNVKDVPAFNLTAIYKLDGDNLSVEVPFDEISYRPSYPIIQVSVLPYFGAGSNTDDGFMFVPEGGGNIINFNNGKIKQNDYYADMYGWDYGTLRKYVNTETYTAFPVFGVSDNKDSFICVMEEGAPYAGITAYISGKINDYNCIRGDYKMLHREQYEVSSRNVSAQYSYEPYLPAGEKIKQVYKFCETGSYVDMAIAYREYLFKNEKKTSNSDVPLAVGIIGAVDKVQQVAGLPKTLPYELTSYEDAAKIINEIEAAGIKNVNYRLVGFINEGVHQTYLSSVKFISELGGKSGFKQMLNAVKNTSAKLYLDATVQTAYRSTLFGEGFNRFTTPARFVSDDVCKIYQYSPIWYGRLDDLDTYYLVKPELAAENTDKFIKETLKYNIGVSFADNGYILSGNYDADHLVSRAASENLQIERFKTIKENNNGLMIRGGNDYAIKYADFITDVNLKGNSYAIFDYSVPFYQIALHGYRNYSAEALNINSELEDIILQSAETASGLYFEFMQADETKLQETNYTKYYAANFNTQKSKFVELYNDYNSKLGKLSNSLIVDYEYMTNKVTRTEFDNGYEIYVNHGYEDYVTASGMKVSSRDYVVVKKGE